MKGKGVTQNALTAFNWFSLAAKEGHAGAQFMLGAAYFFGNGVAKNFKKAMEWFRRAAKQGYASAQGLMAIMYYSGKGFLKTGFMLICGRIWQL